MDVRGYEKLKAKVRGEFLLTWAHNVKKLLKKVLQGTLILPRKYSKLIEEAIPGYREERLTLVGVEV